MSSLASRSRLQERDDQVPQSQDGKMFFVTDSSPLFSYGETGSSSSPWTAGYAMQSDGYDETLHLTTTSHATISFNMTGSSIVLLIPAFADCQASLTINDSTPVPACAKSTDAGDEPFTMFNLPLGVHDMQYDTGPVSTGQQVIFWGVDGSRPMDVTPMTNVTVDDTYSSPGGPVLLSWQGAWAHVDPRTDSGLSEEDSLDNDFNKTVSVTSKTGASVTFSGAGSAVYVYGIVGPDYGSASVSLDGAIVAPHMNLTAPWTMPYQLLWFSTGLDHNQTHNVTLTSLTEQKMAVDFFLLSADSETLSKISTTSSSSSDFISSIAGKLVCFLLVPLVVLVAVALVLWYLFIRRKDHSRSNRSSASHSGIWLRESPSNEKPGGVGFWNNNSSHSMGSLDDGMFIGYHAARAASGLIGHVRAPSKASVASKSVASSRSGRSNRSTPSDASHHSGHSHGTHRSDGSRRSHRSNRSQRAAESPSSHRGPPSTSSHTSSRSNRSHRSRRDYSSTNTSPSTPQQYAPPAVLLANVAYRTLTPQPTHPDGPDGWQRPLRSLLGSSYSHSDPGDHRRQTNLPPYTPGEHGTYPTTISEGPEGQISFNGSGNGFPTASEEKADQFRRMMAAANSPSSSPERTSGPSISRNPSIQPSSCAVPDDRRTNRGTLRNRSEVDQSSSISPSDIMSVYGQPPSERRDSSMTAFTVGDLVGSTSVPVPSTRPQPRVITDLSRDRHREFDGPSSLSSGPANSAQPLLGRDRRDAAPATLYDVNLDHDLGLDLEFRKNSVPSAWKGGRNRILTAMSSTSGTSIGTSVSGARPDSDVIPFEEFYGARER